MTQAVAEATRAQRQYAAAEDDEVMRQLDPTRHDVIRLTASERAQFVAALTPLVNEQRQIFGDKWFGYLEEP